MDVTTERLAELLEKATPAPWLVPLEPKVAGPVQPYDGEVRRRYAGPEFVPVGGCGCCGSPIIWGKTDEQRQANATLLGLAPTLAARVIELETLLATPPAAD